MKKLYTMTMLLSIMIFLGCEKEVPGPTVEVEVPGPTVEVPGPTVTVEVPVAVEPAVYAFNRDGVSTVYYSGQTTRLNQHDEIKGKMNDATSTKAGILAMFNDGTGFTDATLDGSKKSWK